MGTSKCPSKLLKLNWHCLWVCFLLVCFLTGFLKDFLERRSISKYKPRSLIAIGSLHRYLTRICFDISTSFQNIPVLISDCAGLTPPNKRKNLLPRQIQLLWSTSQSLACFSVYQCFLVFLALGMKIINEAWQRSDATNGQKVEKENGDVLVADSLLVFSCLLDVLGLLFQDLRVSWYKSQEFSRRVSFELNTFDSSTYTTDLSEETWTAARAMWSVV